MQERYDEAITILEKVSRLNKTETPDRPALLKALISMKKLTPRPAADEENQKSSDGGRSSSFVAKWKPFFGSSAMTRITVLVPLVWFLQGFCYIGIPLNANNFVGSSFLYMVIASVGELPSPIIAPPMAQRFGRVNSLIFLMVSCSICSLLRLAVPEEMVWLHLVLVLLGMISISSAFLIGFCQVSELFPTCIRGQGISIGSFVGHISYVIAPYITDILAVMSPIVPNAIFGVCGLVAALLIYFLPETNNLRLCETVDDVKKRSKGDW
ncbi:organic cation transporter protein-like [Oratosquilla oratoria]|uniref:organic cation transporter protein-like n=1 Tax=Oratosquilla oratoria TaxID=337810 RepID=UPI003F76A2E7